MDGLLFVLILEVSLLQIRILEKSAVRSFQQHEFSDKSYQQELDKLTRDRNLVKDVIRRTLLEIAENGIPSTLQQAVEMLTKSLTSYASIKIRNVQLKTYDYYKSIDSIFR
ncbi:PREDICTED: uncharacterized protein LOC106107839 [Papilio polytes]|uniref:uncharacterized protein LOC106107839 n=1 Tax=Papilio polytes TaxID=76194 RepID=UPI0006764ECE|nr:PREDICTED: uncharacterized protein LOC106107839 [Papilio polytes]